MACKSVSMNTLFQVGLTGRVPVPPEKRFLIRVAEWADDGTFADKQAMWLVYSVNKEDIWVLRIPLPLKPDKTAFPNDDFATATPGALVPGWNLYSKAPQRCAIEERLTAGSGNSR